MNFKNLNAKKDEINRALDKIVEQSRLDQLSLKKSTVLLMDECKNLLEADATALAAADETTDWQIHVSTGFPSEFQSLIPEKADHIYSEINNGISSIVIPLDCVDLIFGFIILFYHEVLTPKQIESLKILGKTAAEEIDNYIETITSASIKQKIAVKSTEALRARIFEDGADKAVKLLTSHLKLEQIILIYTDPSGANSQFIRYRYYKNGRVIGDSIEQPLEELNRIMKDKEHILDKKDETLNLFLGKDSVIEYPLHNGLNQELIGKLIVKTETSGLNQQTFDILKIFSECLCQRLVDYNREKRILSKSFSPKDVETLLRTEHFFERYLSPREKNIVMMYSDISSFTKICELICKDASHIGNIINEWSHEIIEIIFDYNGVFDKMTGDCIISLFGPPFFDHSDETNALNAMQACLNIVKTTKEVGKRLGLEQALQEKGIGSYLTTSNAIHLGHTSVGFFGPNDDYTCFSSHMNQTARLQTHANYGQTLISSELYKQIHTDQQTLNIDFSAPQEMHAKNVRYPISYHEVNFSIEDI